MEKTPPRNEGDCEESCKTRHFKTVGVLSSRAMIYFDSFILEVKNGFVRKNRYTLCNNLLLCVNAMLYALVLAAVLTLLLIEINYLKQQFLQPNKTSLQITNHCKCKAVNVEYGVFTIVQTWSYDI